MVGAVKSKPSAVSCLYQNHGQANKALQRTAHGCGNARLVSAAAERQRSVDVNSSRRQRRSREGGCLSRRRPEARLASA